MNNESSKTAQDVLSENIQVVFRVLTNVCEYSYRVSISNTDSKRSGGLLKLKFKTDKKTVINNLLFM